MRKIVKLPDGREEIFEGTPEEIAEMEKRLREEGVKPSSGKGRRLLKETEKKLADLQESLRYVTTCPCRQCVQSRDMWKTIPQLPWPDYQPIEPINPWPSIDPILPWPSLDPYPGNPGPVIVKTTDSSGEIPPTTTTITALGYDLSKSRKEN